MLEIQLPAIHRARSTRPTGGDAPQVAVASGIPEEHVLRPSARRLLPVPAAPPPEEEIVRPSGGIVPVEEEIVPIDELLEWERADDGPIEVAIGRLASLLGVAAVAVAILILVFAAGTDIASMFRGLPGS